MEPLPDKEKHPERRISARKKVTILILIAVFVLAMIVAVMWLDPDRITDQLFHRDSSANTPPIDFYPVELSEGVNILDDPEYLSLDHRIHYADPYTGAVYSLEQEDLSSCEQYLRFFYRYFDCVIRGDASAYASLFVPEYDRDTLPASFTMQQIYEISVKPLLNGQAEGNTDTETYLVSYKIRQNNGTFRSDIGSDAERAQLYQLTERDGEMLIVSIVPYTRY